MLRSIYRQCNYMYSLRFGYILPYCLNNNNLYMCLIMIIVHTSVWLLYCVYNESTSRRLRAWVARAESSTVYKQSQRYPDWFQRHLAKISSKVLCWIYRKKLVHVFYYENKLFFFYFYPTIFPPVITLCTVLILLLPREIDFLFIVSTRSKCMTAFNDSVSDLSKKCKKK